jgi:hypothetical protein
MQWAAQASALINAVGDLTLSAETQLATNGLHYPDRALKLEKLMLILHQARSLTELDIPPGTPRSENQHRNSTGRGPPISDLRPGTPIGPNGASTDPNPPFIRGPTGVAESELPSARARREAAYQDLMARVALLEAAVSSLLTVGEPAIGIGHNKGPSDFEAVSAEDLDNVNDLIALLKEQGPIPPSDPTKLIERNEKALQLSARINEGLVALGTEIAKGSAREAGKEMFVPLWTALSHCITSVSHALLTWLG